MTIKTIKTLKTSNTAAFEKLQADTQTLEALALSIVQFCEQQRDLAPSEVDWGHVGSVGHAIEQLAEVKRFLGL